MQQVRIWEITADRKLSELPARYASLEQWIENCLAADLSVLDPSPLVIGRQARTSFGGVVDLLCMDGDGNLVVVELKRGRTPMDVTSQALEYSSWVLAGCQGTLPEPHWFQHRRLSFGMVPQELGG